MGKQSETSGIAEAVKLAGSQQKLAEQLGVTQQLVSSWVRRGYVTISRVVEIEAQYGIPRHRLIDPRLRDLVDAQEVGL